MPMPKLIRRAANVPRPRHPSRAQDLEQAAPSGPGPLNLQRANLSAQGCLQLQRLAGNRAVQRLLATRPAATPAVIQRWVSPSATWTPATGSPEATLIAQLDAQIPAAEQTAVNRVQHATAATPGLNPKEVNYLRAPSPTTWGYVVEEQLNPLARNLGWSTQVVLHGARPDYYRRSNNIDVYADLTTGLQAGLGGNHITDKLQTAKFHAPDPTVYAADVAHQSRNPRGAMAPVLVLGNATLPQMRIFQKYRRYLRYSDLQYNPAMESLVEKYGRTLTHRNFSVKWKKKERRKFIEDYREARLNKPRNAGVNKKRYNLRNRHR